MKGEYIMYIAKASFKNLIGKYDYEFTLREGVNILIGPNGTGKTLMLRAMQRIVGGTIIAGERTPYDAVEITMSDGRTLSSPCKKVEVCNIIYLSEERDLRRNEFEWCHYDQEYDDTLAKFEYFGGGHLSNSFGGRNLTEIIGTVVQAPIGSIILLDLVEIGLHIVWQEKLVDVLMEIAEKDGKQIILTTHSPNVLYGHDDLLVDKQVVVREEVN
jgi:predicted ATP-binding protein involved in virulence